MTGFHDEGSNILGWLSIACWIVVYSPQFLENYQLQSGEGVSVAFIVIWLLGDIFSLAAALMVGLIPTVIILGVYYTLCDIVLLLQIYYYRWKSPSAIAQVHHPATSEEPDSEQTPLLKPAKKDSSSRRLQVVAYVAAVFFVLAVGVAAAILGRDTGGGEGGHQRKEDVIEWKGQLMGWASALLYLSSRFPQIWKNRKTHCAGLSLALFVFTLSGNTTFLGSILVKSLSREHLIATSSWIVASIGTIALDIIVLGQFMWYREARRLDAQGAY